MALRLRRGTDAQRGTITPAEGELIFTTDTKKIYAGDGSTVGGRIVSGINNVLEDITPQLGGNLDINNKDILGTGNINVTGNVIANNFIGDYKGSIVGDDSSVLVDAVNNKITGIVDTTSITATSVVVNGTLSATALQGPLTGAVTGDASGNHSGTFSGVITATGTLDGDLTGSVFADDSTLIVDGINKNLTVNSIVASDIAVAGNLTGSVIGDVLGSLKLVTGGSIFNEDSSILIDGPSTTGFLSKIDSTTNLALEAGGNVTVAATGNFNLGDNDTGGTFRNGSMLIKRSGGAGVALSILTYQNGDNISDIKAVKHRGTVTAPLSYQVNDRTMELVGQAYDGSANRENCFLRFQATAAVSNSVAPGKATMNIANADGTFKEFAFDNDGTYTAINLVSNVGYVKFGNLTTTQRDALTPANGMVIYNTTDNKFQGYENGAWANLI